MTLGFDPELVKLYPRRQGGQGFLALMSRPKLQRHPAGYVLGVGGMYRYDYHDPHQLALFPFNLSRDLDIVKQKILSVQTKGYKVLLLVFDQFGGLILGTDATGFLQGE